MNILVQYFFGNGGAVEHLKILLNAYAQSFPNDKLVVLCHPDAEINKIKIINDRIEVINYGGYIYKEFERLVLLKWKIRKILFDQKIDILWSINIGSYSQVEIPQILSIHNSYQVYPLKNVIQFKNGLLDKTKLLVLRFFTVRSMKQAQCLTVQTDLMKEYVHAIVDKPIYITSKALDNDGDYIACDFADWSPNQVTKNIVENKNVIKFLYIATSEKHKNHLTLLKAFRYINKINPKIKLILTVEKSEFLKRFKNIAKDLIDLDVLWCTGWIPKKYIESLYSYIDLCVIPTLMESFSSAHIEAMKYKKPIITSDMPFSRNICKEAALYAEPLNVDDWVSKIIFLAENTDLQQELIVKGSNRIVDFPENWNVVANSFNTIFEDIFRKNGIKQFHR